MFTVTDSVKNAGATEAKLYPYARILRFGTPVTAGYYILHEGLIGALGGHLQETKYSSIAKSGEESFDSTGGWLGFTDKYWLTALVPTQADSVKARFAHQKVDQTDLYQTDFHDASATVLAPGATVSSTMPCLRRGQGRPSAQRLSRQARHSAVRARGGFRLVLVPDQADLLRPRFHLQAGRQFRRRHPDADHPRASPPVPARQQILPGDEQDEER